MKSVTVAATLIALLVAACKRPDPLVAPRRAEEINSECKAGSDRAKPVNVQDGPLPIPRTSTLATLFAA